MKRKIKDWMTCNSWQMITLLLLLLIIGLPSLFISWSLVDDGYTALISEKITDSIRAFDLRGLRDVIFEKENGRFRPFYWIFNWLVFKVAGFNPHYHYLVHFLLMFVSALTIYSIINKISSNKNAGLLGATFYSASLLSVENWYRLGPVEPIIAALLSLTLYYLFHVLSETKSARKYGTITLLLTILAYLTKESMIVLLPFSLVVLISFNLLKKHSRREIINLSFLPKFALLNTGAVLLLIPIILWLRSEGTYSQSYTLDLFQITSNLNIYLKEIRTSYGIFFVFLLFSYFTRGSYKIFKRKTIWEQYFIWQLLFFVLFALLLAQQLPWQYALNRYLLPSQVGLSLFLGLEAAIILNYVEHKTNYNTSVLLLVLILLMFLYRNLPFFANYSAWVIKRTNAVKELLVYISKTAPENSRVLINAQKGDGTIELVLETKYHLQQFYKRDDLSVQYLDEEAIKQLSNRDFILSGIVSPNFYAISQEELAKMANLKLEKKISFEDRQYSFLSLGEIIKNYYNRYIKLILVLQNPSPFAIISQTVTFNEWQIYRSISKI